MKRFLLPIVLAGLLLATFGCACKGHMIDATAINDSLTDVAARHDAYVRADASLDQLEKDTYLRDTELLMKILAQAMVVAP